MALKSFSYFKWLLPAFLLSSLVAICAPASQSAEPASKPTKPSMNQFEGKISFINMDNYSVNVIAGGYSSTLYMGRSSKLTSSGKEVAFTDLKVGQKLHLTPGVSEGGILKISHFDILEPKIKRSSPLPKPKTSKLSGKIESLDPFNGRMTVSLKGRWYTISLPREMKWKGKGQKGLMGLQKGKKLTVEVQHFGVGRTEAISIDTGE